MIVHDVARGPVEELVAAGAADGGSARAVTQQSDIVITMLPDSPEVRQVVLGPEGVAEAVRPGQVVVDMSTISPLTSREVAAALEARGVPTLDAPVSGGQKGAIEAPSPSWWAGPARPSSAYSRSSR